MKRLLSGVFALLFSGSAFAIVDMRNANFSDTWTDIIIPGSGYDLRVVRTYNSRTLFNGVFGFGWCADFESKLEIMPEDGFKLTECGGGLEITFVSKDFDKNQVKGTIKTIIKEVRSRNKALTERYIKELEGKLEESSNLREEFSKRLKIQGNIQTGKVYYADGRENETIVKKGNQYIRTLPDSTYQKFSLSGQLEFMYDRNGNYLKLSYQKDLLSSIVDNNGRKLTFKYKPGTRRVAAIIGPNNMQASYEYSGEDLTSATTAWKNKYQYAYDDLHNLVRIDFPDKTFKKLTYNKDRDWVTSFTNREGCVETYEYDSNKKDPLNHYWSKVKKVCGKQVVNNSSYEFFHKMKADGTGRYLYRARSENNNDVTDIIYHEVFGKPVSVFRNNIKVTYDYFDDGFVKLKKEPGRVTSFEYKNKCKKVSNVTVQLFATPTPNDKKPASVKPKLIKTSKTAFRYDEPKCNLAFAANSDGQKISLVYDQRGRIERITDQAKKVVTIKYEERFGKPSVVSRPGLGTIVVKYKADGQIDKVESKEGPTVAVQVASIFNNLLEIIGPATAETTL